MKLMLRSTCIALSTAAAFHCAAATSAEDPGAGAGTGAPASAAPEGATLLLDTIALWLASNFDLPQAAGSPGLVFASPERLASMRYGENAASEVGNVVAVYRDDEDTIYLGEALDGSTPAGLSVVVHEMVHYLQDVGGMRFACPGEREAVAYEAQEAWLEMFGTGLEREFQIDAATLMLRTTCAY